MVESTDAPVEGASATSQVVTDDSAPVKPDVTDAGENAERPDAIASSEAADAKAEDASVEAGREVAEQKQDTEEGIKPIRRPSSSPSQDDKSVGEELSRSTAPSTAEGEEAAKHAAASGTPKAVLAEGPDAAAGGSTDAAESPAAVQAKEEKADAAPGGAEDQVKEEEPDSGDDSDDAGQEAAADAERQRQDMELLQRGASSKLRERERRDKEESKEGEAPGAADLQEAAAESEQQQSAPPPEHSPSSEKDTPEATAAAAVAADGGDPAVEKAVDPDVVGKDRPSNGAKLEDIEVLPPETEELNDDVDGYDESEEEETCDTYCGEEGGEEEAAEVSEAEEEVEEEASLKARRKSLLSAPAFADKEVWSSLPRDIQEEIKAEPAGASAAARPKAAARAKAALRSPEEVPPGVDAAVWASLPLDMRQELACLPEAAWAAIASSRTDDSASTAPLAAASPESPPEGVDPEVWRSLPNDIRQELQQLPRAAWASIIAATAGRGTGAKAVAGRARFALAKPKAMPPRTGGTANQSFDPPARGSPPAAAAAKSSGGGGSRRSAQQRQRSQARRVSTAMGRLLSGMKDTAVSARRSFFGGSSRSSVTERTSLLNAGDPVRATSSSGGAMREEAYTLRQVCHHGAACTDRDQGHRQGFAHVGDSDYRNGLVIFAEGDAPELSSLRAGS
eukprot:TRINITY_DN17201_c0_g1_i1.p1 TRINITY_DN17201_c0_g1~~TRINITY_DN17201_c0_g1_i1.p1  ORF type:complete len:680 (+),score=181.03 TRINITY_DN17201_c0_g1_i1:75-2114(+)